jgi:hypothetical protein
MMYIGTSMIPHVPPLHRVSKPRIYSEESPDLTIRSVNLISSAGSGPSILSFHTTSKPYWIVDARHHALTPHSLEKAHSLLNHYGSHSPPKMLTERSTALGASLIMWKLNS